MNHHSAACDTGVRPVGRLSLRAAHAVLAAVMLVACGLVTYFFAWPSYGRDGISASFSGAAVCWIGAALAMTASKLFRGPQRALAVTAVGMALRMGLPLVAVMVVMLRGGPIARGGFLVCIVSYYALALVLETWLTLKLMSLPERAEAH